MNSGGEETFDPPRKIFVGGREAVCTGIWDEPATRGEPHMSGYYYHFEGETGRFWISGRDTRLGQKEQPTCE